MGGHSYCRHVLRLTMVEVRKHTTVEQRNAAWAWKSGQHVEFHGPDGFYWNGRGDCLWDARHKGWERWLEGKENHD